MHIEIIQSNFKLFGLILFLAFGACMGSFFAVVVCRLPLGISLSLRSHCQICKNKISMWHNIPIFSFLWLKGQCSHCLSSIGLRNWFFEVLFLLLALVFYVKWGFSIAFFEHYFWVSALIIIAYIDMDTYYIPNIMIIILFILALFSLSYYLLFYPDYFLMKSYQPTYQLLSFKKIRFSLSNQLWGGFLGFGLLFIINYIATKIARFKKRIDEKSWAMGFGDLWLMASIGFRVGLNNTFLVILLASFFGSIYGALERWFSHENKNKPLEGAIPFGSFLSLAAIYVLA